MTKKKNVTEAFDSIQALKGNDEFKQMVQRLNFFLHNKAVHGLPEISLPSYLLSIAKGGGITNLANTFANFLHATGAIEFCGNEKMLEFSLRYKEPELYFSELTRLNNKLTEAAGYNHKFKGLVCVNIEQWHGHEYEPHFSLFLDYVAENKDILAVFYTHKTDEKALKGMEAAISLRLRIEPLALRFPNAAELTEYVEAKHFNSKGFSLADDARATLQRIVGRLVAGAHFGGFKSIDRLAQDILYSVLSQGTIDSKLVSNEILAAFDKDTTDIDRINTLASTKKIIGFTEERG